MEVVEKYDPSTEIKYADEMDKIKSSILNRKISIFENSVKKLLFTDGDLKYMNLYINMENYEKIIKLLDEDIFFFNFFKISGKNIISGFLLYMSVVLAFDENLLYEVYKIVRSEFELSEISQYILNNKNNLLIEPPFYLDYLGDLEKDFQPSFDKEIYLKTVGLNESVIEYSKKPEWVSIMPTESIIHLNNGIDFFEKIMKKEEVDLVKEFIQDTFEFDKNKIDLFRLYGPENKMKYSEDEEETETSPENKCIDCRMLRCTCLGEDEEDSENWFGRCNICSLFIRDISWSVRIPHKEGGWYGCYCCFDCALKDVSEDNIDNFKNFKNQIMAIGIMDRCLY